MSPVATGGLPHTSVNGGGPVSTMNGSTVGDIGGSKGAGRIFPHLDDLTSVKPHVDINWPIRRILQDAELLAKQADTHLDFRRPDLAVEEFMKAYILATEFIPHHKDYPSLSGNQSELHRSYMGLLKRIKAQEPRFNEAKRIIKEDNEKSGVRALSSGKENSLPGSMNGAAAAANGHQNGNHVNGTSNVPSISSDGASPRKKPPVQPKPDALHGKALHPPSNPGSASDQSDLASRFARLRTPVQDPRIRTQPISIPEDSEYTIKPTSASQSTTVRPLGPREMPSVPTASPRQIRTPIDVQVPEMPKPPDAIYSPSRNPDTAATINFPTSIPRSSSYIGAGNNAAPPVSTVGRTPSFDGRQEYFSPAHKMSDNAPRRQDPVLPNTTTVSASELTEYIRMGSQKIRILLVDVRSREDFDEGHIMSQSIICIEPVILRDGISSEELMESLVLSPESELSLYERRHEFDLVVFYDQRSMSHKGDNRQGSDASYLENFSKAMYEYGYEKQLKRRPRLLLGGLDAWADLMGPSSLQSSSTGSTSAKKSNGNGVKSARPLGRVPMAREPYRFPVRKRTYESRPLSKEEESKWDETLREHPTHESPTAVEQDGADELSYVRTTEDFFRRYPELPSIQESMISARPAPPTYRVEPFNSIPPPPARPAPALPRQRSSGVLEKEPIAEYAMMSTTGITSSGPTPGLCGLRNNGVSCYVAAVVQCLSASGRLRDYLKGFNPGPGTRVPRKAGETTDPPQLLVRNFGNLLGHMWSGHYDFVVPNTFLGYVNAIHMASMPRKSPKSQAFGGTGRQHDSSEFLMYLITVLHDEMNRKRNKPDYLQQLMDIYKAQTEHLSEKEKDRFHDKSTDLLDTRDAIRQEWRRKLAGDDSVFSNLFHGMDAQLIKCTKPDCRYVKKNWREFSVLQMQFPPKYTEIGSRFPSINLTEIFRHMFNLENPDPLTGYKCVNCNRENTCFQDRAVTYLPDYLILEFSRFQANQYEPERDNAGNPIDEFQAFKIKTRIKFSEKIDLKPIFIPVDPPPSRPGDKEDVRGCVEPFIYDCYGIIIHKGQTVQSGHYIAFTRNLDMPGQSQSRWHQFNDQTVTPAEFPDTQRPDTHVTHIFMKRRKN